MSDDQNMDDFFKNFDEFLNSGDGNFSMDDLPKDDFSKDELNDLQSFFTNFLNQNSGGSGSEVNWEVAKKIAPTLANSTEEDSGLEVQASEEDGKSVMAFDFMNQVGPANKEAPVSLGDKAKIEQIARITQANVAQRCDFIHVLEGSIDVVNKTEMADHLLGSIKPFFESLARTLKRTFNVDSMGLPREDEEQSSQEQMINQIAPTMLGAQAGSMIGYLCRSALDASELLTFSGNGDLVICCPNMVKFSSDWTLNQDTFYLYALTLVTIRVGQRTVPWVDETIKQLSQDFANTYNFSSQHVFENMNMPEEMEDIEKIESQPEMVLGALRTPEQEAVLTVMRKFLSILEGYASVVTERIVKENIPDLGLINEAMRRHQIERGAADKFMNMFLGIDLKDADLKMGEDFCRGVIERSLEDNPQADPLDCLNKIFEKKNNWPTDAELTAPGLWIARLEFM